HRGPVSAIKAPTGPRAASRHQPGAVAVRQGRHAAHAHVNSEFANQVSDHDRRWWTSRPDGCALIRPPRAGRITRPGQRPMWVLVIEVNWQIRAAVRKD